MYSKRLGLGILTLAVGMIAACTDDNTQATSLVAPPNQPSLSRAGNGGGKPHVSATSVRVAITPTSMQLGVGSGTWMHVTLYDKNGNMLPDNDGSLVWYGCTPSNPAMQVCTGYLNIAPVYPNLRDAYVAASGAGLFTVWADDGAGHRASATVTVQ